MRLQFGRRAVPWRLLGVALLVGSTSTAPAQSPAPTQPPAPTQSPAPTQPPAPTQEPVAQPTWGALAGLGRAPGPAPAQEPVAVVAEAAAEPAPAVTAAAAAPVLAPAPAQEPLAAPNLPVPATPGPAVPPAEVSAAVPGTPADYEARIQQLEAIVRQLQAQQLTGPAVAPGGVIMGNPDPGTPVGRPGVGLSGPGAGAATPSAAGGATAPGQSQPPNPPPNKRFDSPATLVSRPGTVKFGPGFEIKTDDEEFFFQFHNLTQFDYRGYQQGGQSVVHDTFAVPRQWFMFSGRITRPVGYFVSVAQAFDTLNGLDYFIDLNYDPRIQVRMGRMKTPFTYEFLVEPVQGMINPERSLFFNNFGQNRDVGVMTYGRFGGGLLDYAAGVFNGSRNGYVSTQDSKFFSGFVNSRPFKDNEGSLLENFNIGGSVFAGNANSLAVPQVLRTAVPTTGNAVLGVPFMTFNNNVREIGNEAFWDLHMAYFYNHLALITEWQSGAKDYSLTGNPNRNRIGVESFYIQAGYLLTGETRSGTGIVKPLRPFDLRKGQRGPGAWEPTFRYNYLDIGSQVYSSGLVDPNTSANRVSMTDLGFNWHLTQYMKLYFDWEHAAYNQPVTFAPGRRQLTSDLFLIRFQLYF